MAQTDNILITRPRVLKNGESWRVTYYEDGKRKHRQFRDQSKAFDLLAQLQANTIDDDMAFDQRERILFAQIKRHARLTGQDLGDIVAQCLSANASRSRFATIWEAWVWYERSMVDRNIRSAYRVAVEQMVKPFAEHFSGIHPDRLMPHEIVAYIMRSSSGVVARKTMRSRIFTFLRKAGARIDYEAVTWLDPKTDGRKVEFWDHKTVADFLDGVAMQYKIPLAICFFSGLRPKGELERIRWEDFDFDNRILRIRGEVDKMRREWKLHDLPDNFWSWAEYGRGNGRVLTLDYDGMRKRVRSFIQSKDLPKWPHDCTRHSFATHGYHRGLEWAVAIMRQVSGFRLFADRYKGEVSQADAEAYFQIVP